MNFNFDSTTDYTLNTSLIQEVINMYGILTKFLVVQKINLDDGVFGDYSHLKSDGTKIFDMYMLPEISEDWDNSNFGFNEFGFNNFENIQLFVSKFDIDNVPELTNNIGKITGNLIILPNNKIMEITDTQWQVPGINNLFTSSAAKSVIKLSCKPYDIKLTSELAPSDISANPNVPNNSLDTYFQELVNQTNTQNTQAEVIPDVQTVQKTGTAPDTTVQKPIVDRSEDSVFGKLG